MSASEQAKKINALKIERTKQNKAVKAARHAKRMEQQAACTTRGAARKTSRVHKTKTVNANAIIVDSSMRHAFDLDNIRLDQKYNQENVTNSLDTILHVLKSKSGQIKLNGWNASLSFRTARELNAPMYDTKSPLFNPSYA